MLSPKESGFGGQRAPGHPRRRFGSDQILRPPAQPPERLCIRLGQDALLGRQHRSYLQYAYTRIRSIFRKAQESGARQNLTVRVRTDILLAPEEIVPSIF